jgi:formylglycine-generating enzyme required for sulfatase activity
MLVSWILILTTSPVGAEDLPPTMTSKDGAAMVLVPAGQFLMGSHSGAPEEAPPHGCRLPAFYIDRHEVTVAQYAVFVAETGHAAPAGWQAGRPAAGEEQLPITNICWSDAMRYAIWAGKRLPTESEWERAARGTNGRKFPWGNVDREEFRNKGSGKLRPVGSLPGGASPVGCLDMSGNAWEWTSDWFHPYPNSNHRSVHFGRHYKVIRGGAGEYLYATTNAGTTTQRARLVPYGSHDFIGFRCVQDPPGQSPPYDPEALLREAEESIQAVLHDPRPLTHEQKFEEMNRAGLIPLRIRDVPGSHGLVTVSLPLPEGRIFQQQQISIVTSQQEPLPVAAKTLASWPDGSIRWLLLRFLATDNKHVYARLSDKDIPARPPERPLVVEQSDNMIRITTGRLDVTFTHDQLIQRVRYQDHDVAGPLKMPFVIASDGKRRHLQFGAANRMEILSQSPLEAVVRLQGRWVDQDGEASPFSYDLRVQATCDSSRLRAWLTTLHAAPRQRPWEDLIPSVDVLNWAFQLRLNDQPDTWIAGGDGASVTANHSSGESLCLSQPDDLHYSISLGDQPVAEGTRAAGWLSAQNAQATVSLGVRHFWQNHPQQLVGDDQTIGVAFWSGPDALSWEGGLAKTHEVVLDFSEHPPQLLDTRVERAVPPPAWMCGTLAAGDLLPRNDQALRHFAYWECWREDAMRRWVNAMPTGSRDFGDGYMGGPYKGKNAYVNLEYDVTLNFLHQFLRTGDFWYLDAADSMARHQGDIDTENVAGFAWKHSPSHTTTQAEFGHVFLRGLLLHHLLTGDVRDREVAERIGDWVADALIRGHGVGNERQIGWSLYALTALHQLTGKPIYLKAAQTLCERLCQGQSPTGKFDIRWDNRIAFFNGIAMNGMLEVNDILPQQELQQSVLRVAHRTLGMYPDYACRTLNAFCWAAKQYHDPRILHNIQRTWISSLEFLLDRDCTTSETHAWRFPTFAVRHNLLPQLVSDAGELPAAGSWQSHRLRSPQVELFLRPRKTAQSRLLIVREGLATGVVKLFDAAGRQLQEVDLANLNQLIQTASLQLPQNGTWFRITLVSEDAFAWQIHYDQHTDVTFADPNGQLLPSLLPMAVGSVDPDQEEVTIRLEAIGEGFHSATLFDASGSPRGRVQRFIDFEDPGRYEMTIQVPATRPLEGWSLELNAVRVLAIEGFSPYWAASRAGWFDPETTLP